MGDCNGGCRFITSISWLASSIWLLTQVETLGDSNKTAASPPHGGGLRAQSRSPPMLRLGVITIKVAASPPRGCGFRA